MLAVSPMGSMMGRWSSDRGIAPLTLAIMKFQLELLTEPIGNVVSYHSAPIHEKTLVS